MENVYGKLCVRNRTQAVGRAFYTGRSMRMSVCESEPN
jgi:ATP/maltotriose-dependent transcriptional regulator MalT